MPTGKIHGGLATRLTASADAKTFTFDIRAGTKCHDGTIFDARAAKWNIDRVVDPKTGQPERASFGDIAGTQRGRRHADHHVEGAVLAAADLPGKPTCADDVPDDDPAVTTSSPLHRAVEVRRMDPQRSHRAAAQTPTTKMTTPSRRIRVRPMPSVLSSGSFPEGPLRMAALKDRRGDFRRAIAAGRGRRLERTKATLSTRARSVAGSRHISALRPRSRL